MAFIGQSREDKDSLWVVGLCLDKSDCELLKESVEKLSKRIRKEYLKCADKVEGGYASARTADKMFDFLYKSERLDYILYCIDMAKSKPGDKVIISQDSNNIRIQGKRGTIVRFLEEDYHPWNLYQWTYEVKLEDRGKSYVPQWEMELDSGIKHHCIFEISYPNKHSECYFCKFVQDFGEDQKGADMMCESMNNFRKPEDEVMFIHRLLEQGEFDEIQNYLKQFPHANVANIYSPFIKSVTVQSVI